MKRITVILNTIVQFSKKLWHNSYSVRYWLGEKGYNNGYDLGVADEVFAFYSGIVLFVAYNSWAAKSPRIVTTIILAVAVNFAAIIIAINQKKFYVRIGFYILALILALIGIAAIEEVSGHDLNWNTANLGALFVGILVWAGIRETAIFVINLIRRD